MTDGPRRPGWAELDAVDGAAVADVVASLSDQARERLGASAERVAGITMVSVLAEPSPFFNRATGLGSAGEHDLAAVVAHYRGLGRSSFGILLNDAIVPSTGTMEGRGFGRGPGSPKLWRAGGRVDGLRSTDGVRVEITTDPELVAEVTTTGFGWGPHLHDWCAAPVGRKDWTHHVAYLRGTPVGVAATFRCGRSAWFGGGATRPEFRGRGVHTALIARRIADAADCDHLVAETGDAPNASLRNLERQGFTQVHHRTNWLWSTA